MNNIKNIQPKSVREYYAFFGGEESGVSLENVSKIWDAAIKSVYKNSDTCNWEFDDIACYYHGNCGIDWCFTDGTLKDNEVNYCPKCGRKVIEVEVNG